MKHREARLGRTFVLRLEDGEVVHEKIEAFAREHGIRAAALIILGGADQGSRLVVGPERGRDQPVSPMEHLLGDVHEVAGTGTLFPDEKGNPVLHMHLACGRNDATITGCVRRGVAVWHIMEAVLFELSDLPSVRAADPKTGFSLLEP